jgi:DNA repair protein RecO (recombination protein O)
MVETADRLVAEESEPAPHQLLVGALRAANGGTCDGPRPASLILDSDLLRALAVAGYAPSFSNCARCGVTGLHRAFSAALSGVKCERCRPGGAAHASDTLALLGVLIEGSCSEAHRVPDHVAREAGGIASAFAAWHVDRNLESVTHVEC